MKYYGTRSEQFEISNEDPCILIQSEEPVKNMNLFKIPILDCYAILDVVFSRYPFAKYLLIRDFRNISRLYGPFFDILGQIDPLKNSFRVWAVDCLLEYSLCLIGNISKLCYHHKLIAGELMCLTEPRITKT